MLNALKPIYGCYGKRSKSKHMYQTKVMKGIIATHFKLKKLYPWPNCSSNISIKTFIVNDMERLKIESKWANVHFFFWYIEVILWPKMTKSMQICSFWLNFQTFHINPDNFFDRNFWGVVGSRVKLLWFKVCTNNLFHWFWYMALLAFMR